MVDFSRLGMKSFFNEHKVGLKYLIFDPFKNKEWHGMSMYSWKK